MEQIAEIRARLERAAFVKHTVGLFTSQRELDMMLLQERDVFKRRQLFNFVLPHVKFDNPQFPEDRGAIITPRIILPHEMSDEKRG